MRDKEVFDRLDSILDKLDTINETMLKIVLKLRMMT